MYLASKTVSPGFRLFMLQQYPALEHNLAYRRLTEYILFGTIDDEESGHLRISRKLLASLEGREEALRQHRYIGQDLLTCFSRDVAPIVVGPWHYADGLARIIENDVFPSDVLDAARDELCQLRQHGDVYFATGRLFTRQTQAEARQHARAEANLLRGEAPNAATLMLLDYMNSRPSHGFTRMLTHLSEAKAVAEMPERFAAAQTAEEHEKLKLLRKRLRNLLGAIQDQPQPYYKPAAHSARIYALNESVFRCTREVRKALTQDWFYFDLQSAQLATCAFDWRVVEMMAFLMTDQNIWDEFGASFPFGRDRDMKSVFKTAGYATTFGAAKKGVFKIFDTAGRTRPEARLFLSHPLMLAMFKKREERIYQILCDGGAWDCYGNWIPVLKKRYNTRGHYYWAPNARSVLAQLAQARELQLMLPIVEMARQTNQFTIMLWLHDGCYIAFRDATRKQLWSTRIIEAVNCQAAALGIPTKLMPDNG